MLSLLQKGVPVKELKLTLAQVLEPRLRTEPFRISADTSDPETSGPGKEQAARYAEEGTALADLLFKSLPGATLIGLIHQLEALYSKQHPSLNPFLDFDDGREDFHSDG